MNNETETNEDPKQHRKIKDKWDKLEILLHPIGGFFTGLAIAAVGYFGSAALEDRQTNEINMRLYSELMNQREQAENKLRSDMFKQIFDSFLGKTEQEQNSSTEEENELADVNNIDDAIKNSRNLLTLVNNELLRLELLTRNFHESIDIKPIFYDLLFKILHVKRPLRAIDCAGRIKKNRKALVDTSSGFKKVANRKTASEIQKNCPELEHYSSRDEQIIEKFSRPGNTNDKNKYLKINNLLKEADRKITKLRSIAHRISDKQIENLANQTNYKKITVSFDQVCDDVRPTKSEITCDKTNPYDETVMLNMKVNEKEYQRIFHIKVANSYTKWSQVHVRIQASLPNEDVTCEEKKDDIHNMCADFWVSSFDFPLVDNTYLSEEERYGIAIDNIDENKKLINLVLVYFPASYAGLKEKSFYHKKVLNHLDKWAVIQGEDN
ncbi:hypothetical protein [Kaarinaea lacus]